MPSDEMTKTPRNRRSLALALGLGGLIGAIVIMVLVFLFGGGATITVNQSALPRGDAVKVADALAPAVGTIIVTTSNGQSSLGSGFIIAHGHGVSYMLTNDHVITGARDIHVAMPNGETLGAVLVGGDAFDDLAVVSINDASLPVAQFGESSQVNVGETVIAIGSPLGNAGSVTVGVVSALHRTITAGDQSASSETLQDVLQTDAAIDPGNSGGPLADVAGRVIGVNVAFSGSTTRIGYSIPSDLAASVAQQLISGTKIEHPYLGITYLSAIDAVEAGRAFNGPGVLVTGVASGSPAQKAGFKSGDIVVSVDGVTIDNGQTLGALVENKQVGQRVTFVVSRTGSKLTITVVLSQRPGT